MTASRARLGSVATDDVVQERLDRRNADFWNEPCGTQLARSLGIREVTDDALRRFDDAYFRLYPYLRPYADDEPLRGKNVLEVGLGFGTLGQHIAERGAVYHGLDLAEEPVSIMRLRLQLLDGGRPATVVQGSVLAIPFADASFDYVYSIGCLHHTGSIARSVAEIERVLRPRGKAIVMLYNSRSFRQLVRVPRERLLARVTGDAQDERVRRLYDANELGEAAPHTEYVSKGDVRKLFASFRNVDVRARNFDGYSMLRGRLVLRREWFLGTIDRFLGLDLYVVAEK